MSEAAWRGVEWPTFACGTLRVKLVASWSEEKTGSRSDTRLDPGMTQGWIQDR